MAKMHARAEEFLEICQTRYLKDPVLFCDEVLNVKLTSQQATALDKLAKGSKKRVAIKSGHGTGKSCMEACSALWFLCTRPFARVIVTAPSSNQLYNTMMSEIASWYYKSVLSELNLFYFTKDRVRLNHEQLSNSWFLSAVSVANPENISGTHAEHVLAIIDEAAGVDDEIFIRLDGVLTTDDCYQLVAGNPSFDSGYFYDIFHKEEYSRQYDTFTFSCVDSPNVNREWIQTMKDKYGEDSPRYKVRVLGEFAPMDEEVIIRREYVKDAIARDKAGFRESDPVYFGIDVSSGDSNDYSVICVRRGNEELERIKVKLHLTDLKNKCISMITEYSYHAKSVIVNIDTTGIGYQLGQDLDEYFYGYEDIEINRINFSYRAELYGMFGNVFTEMFFMMKDRIKNVSLLNIPESTLEEDLGSRRYDYTNRGLYMAEKKKTFIKRFRRSPDEGDAVLLAFYDTAGIGALEMTMLDSYGEGRYV